MDLARALPMDSVVVGFLLGGGGGCTADRALPEVCSFLGRVEYCRPLWTAAALPADTNDIEGEAEAEAVSVPNRTGIWTTVRFSWPS